ncbi:peptide deformylase [Patescibacteria group bacterium]|nr:peptide deformylase [Patescibacteria group bacterium]
MIRPIITATDAILRRKSKPIQKIDKKTLALVKDLKDTLFAKKDPAGIGLAASQIGKNANIFVIKPADDIRVFINPEILSIKKVATINAKKNHKRIMEGCLSIPNYYGPLTRPGIVKLKYQTPNGEYKTEDFDKLPAHIIQHEVDHLKGILFVDRLLEQKQKLYELIDGEWEEVDLII